MTYTLTLRRARAVEEAQGNPRHLDARLCRCRGLQSCRRARRVDAQVQAEGRGVGSSIPTSRRAAAPCAWSRTATSDFVEMPFFLEQQEEFDFELLERTVEVDHVIFKIGFKPKSEFKALPSGVVLTWTRTSTASSTRSSSTITTRFRCSSRTSGASHATGRCCPAASGSSPGS